MENGLELINVAQVIIFGHYFSTIVDILLHDGYLASW